MVKKGVTILTGILVVYVALVATHKGEFWPFSIYPMFSQGAHPWTHSMVRDVSHIPQINWHKKDAQSKLPGQPFALDQLGMGQNDLTAFIDKTNHWSQTQIQGLRYYFRGKLDKHDYLIFKVHGHISKGSRDTVVVSYHPFILIRKDTTIFNPSFSGRFQKD